MPNFNVRVGEIVIFGMRDRYMFKTYFDETRLFRELKKCYNENEHRFKIPEGDLEKLRQVPDKYYYELDIEGDVEDYCIVVDKKSKTASALRNSVARTQEESTKFSL